MVIFAHHSYFFGKKKAEVSSIIGVTWQKGDNGLPLVVRCGRCWKLGMDKKENLRCALLGKPHEWIPASFFLHLRPEELEGEACVRFHRQFYEKTDVDFLKIMHDGLSAPCTLRPSSLQELKEYRPGRDKNPYVAAYLERAKRVNEAMKGEADTYVNLFSPFTLLRRIGDEKLLAYIREDKAGVRDVLLRLAEELGELAERMVTEAGCLGTFLAFQGAEQNLFSAEEYESLVMESDRRVLEQANRASRFNILHFCGWNQVKNRLELWRDYPGCAVNWATCVEGMGLPKGRRYFGMRPVLGGFDNRRSGVLYRGSRQQVVEETRRILSEYKAAFGGFDGLLVGADCSFLTDFEIERFGWVRDEIRRW